MKYALYSFMLLTLLFTSCKQENDLPQPASEDVPVLTRKSILTQVPAGEPTNANDVKAIVLNELQTKGDLRWTSFDLQFIWSAANVSRLVAVGYQVSGTEDISQIIDKINIHSAEWRAVHDAIVNLVLNEINTHSSRTYTAEEIIYEDDDILPVIIFRMNDKYAMTALQNLQNVRYMEPYGYWPYDDDRSSSGCDASTQALNAADYTTNTPGCLVPWNYPLMNITSAWTVAQGDGIQIGVIDGGISSSQTLLGSQFSSGLSNNARMLTTDFTLGTSAYTSCTHGTSMCGLAAGPRNANNAVTGVAYKSPLHFIRACENVVLDKSSELSGVKNALVRMGNLPDIKIISMSIGTPFYSGVLLDGVTYAYNKGKLIFAAAGTSFSWTSWWGVIYPAAYSQCVAVTGVRENGTTCSTCHDGSQVQFTVLMERNANNSRNSLSLAQSGSVPTYIGGSSCATATSAGIAALVWSVKPTLSRAQVLTCLTNTAQFYPVRNSFRGYGNLNAYAAVTMAQGM